jgi:integrase
MTLTPGSDRDGRLHEGGKGVRLSEGTLDVLREMVKLRINPKADGFVFFSGKPGKPLSTMALLMLLRRMGRGDLTAHGYRTTFRDWCAEATNFPREVAEAALAHTLRDKTEAAYQRGDLMEKRPRLMADWATFCARPTAAGEVVPLRAGA